MDTTISISKIQYNPQYGIYNLNDRELDVLGRERSVNLLSFIIIVFERNHFTIVLVYLFATSKNLTPDGIYFI